MKISIEIEFLAIGCSSEATGGRGGAPGADDEGGKGWATVSFFLGGGGNGAGWGGAIVWGEWSTVERSSTSKNHIVLVKPSNHIV